MTADEIRVLADKMESMASFVARVLGHSVDAHDCRRAAAALRELVEDRERLERVMLDCIGGIFGSEGNMQGDRTALYAPHGSKGRIYRGRDFRAAIDAAMRGERGERGEEAK